MNFSTKLTIVILLIVVSSGMAVSVFVYRENLKFLKIEIAQELEISLTTVKTHMREVLRKFDVRGRYQLRYMLRRWDFSNYLAGNSMNWPSNLGS